MSAKEKLIGQSISLPLGELGEAVLQIVDATIEGGGRFFCCSVRVVSSSAVNGSLLPTVIELFPIVEDFKSRLELYQIVGQIAAVSAEGVAGCFPKVFAHGAITITSLSSFSSSSSSSDNDCDGKQFLMIALHQQAEQQISSRSSHVKNARSNNNNLRMTLPGRQLLYPTPERRDLTFLLLFQQLFLVVQALHERGIYFRDIHFSDMFVLNSLGEGKVSLSLRSAFVSSHYFPREEDEGKRSKWLAYDLTCLGQLVREWLHANENNRNEFRPFMNHFLKQWVFIAEEREPRSVHMTISDRLLSSLKDCKQRYYNDYYLPMMRNSFALDLRCFNHQHQQQQQQHHHSDERIVKQIEGRWICLEGILMNDRELFPCINSDHFKELRELLRKQWLTQGEDVFGCLYLFMFSDVGEAMILQDAVKAQHDSVAAEEISFPSSSREWLKAYFLCFEAENLPLFPYSHLLFRFEQEILKTYANHSSLVASILQGDFREESITGFFSIPNALLADGSCGEAAQRVSCYLLVMELFALFSSDWNMSTLQTRINDATFSRCLKVIDLLLPKEEKLVKKEGEGEGSHEMDGLHFAVAAAEETMNVRIINTNTVPNA